MLESKIGRVMTKLACAFVSYLFGVSICLWLPVLSFRSSASMQLDFRGSLNVSSAIRYCISSWKMGIGSMEHNIKLKF